MINIKLVSKDKREFVVDVEVAKCSCTVKEKLSHLTLEVREEGNEIEIPLPNVEGMILEKLLTWIKYHKENQKNFDWDGSVKGKAEVGEWDAAFIEDLDKEVMLCAEGVPHVKLRSCDGVLYLVETEIAALIPKVNQLMRANGVDDGKGEIIRVSEGVSRILEKVIMWVKLHKDELQTQPPEAQDENIISELDKIYLKENLEDARDLSETLELANTLELEAMVNLIAKHFRINILVERTHTKVRKGQTSESHSQNLMI